MPDAEVWRAALKSLFQQEVLAPTLMGGMPCTSFWLQEPCEQSQRRELGCPLMGTAIPLSVLGL